jgi:hypothetical protein
MSTSNQSQLAIALLAVPTQQRWRVPCVILAVKDPQIWMRCKDGCVDVICASAPQNPQRLHPVQRHQPPAFMVRPVECVG